LKGEKGMQLLVNLDDLRSMNVKVEDDGEVLKYIRFALSEVDSTAKVYTKVASIVRGDKQPERVSKIVADWNNQIRHELSAQLEKFTCPAESISLDTVDTYRLRKAAKQADNSFSVYGNHGILQINNVGERCFTTVLSLREMQYIQRFLNEWAVAEVISVF